MKPRPPRHPRKKLRPRRTGPLMKRYTVECPDCKRHYELDFTGPVKFCSFCRSEKIKVSHRPAPVSSILAQVFQGFAFGAGFAVMDRYLSQTDSANGKPGDYIHRALKSPNPPGKQDTKQ